VKVRDEIDFTKSYFYLMKVRFDNSIDLNVKIANEIMDSFVPPLTLQILVENAIKHNQFSKDDPLTIKIESLENKFLIVSNNISDKPKPATSFRVGLNNISKRYEYFTHIPVRFTKADEYKVQLPVILTRQTLEEVA